MKRITATNLGRMNAVEICQTCGAQQCPSQIEAGQCFCCIAKQLKVERDEANRKLAQALESLPLSTNATREQALEMLGIIMRHKGGANEASHGCVEVNVAVKAIDLLIGQRNEAIAKAERRAE